MNTVAGTVGSWASSPGVRRCMRGNKSKNTKPELAIRRILFADGFRYRVCARPLPGYRHTADIVFPRRKIAIFVDGCFWHGCPLHYHTPKTHGDFWSTKIKANKDRDAKVDSHLKAAGWTVVHIWEHVSPQDAASEVEKMMLSRISETIAAEPQSRSVKCCS